MRRKYNLLAVSAILTILFALSVSHLHAQDSLTLESLSEQLSALKERVAQTERLLTPNAFVEEDGSCKIAMWKRPHAMSMVKYLEAYPDVALDDMFHIVEVSQTADQKTVVVFHVIDYPNSKRIAESWNGCEFDGSTEWYWVDSEGRRIEEE